MTIQENIHNKQVRDAVGCAPCDPVRKAPRPRLTRERIIGLAHIARSMRICNQVQMRDFSMLTESPRPESEIRHILSALDWIDGMAARASSNPPPKRSHRTPRAPIAS